jgi:Holliday junction resolvasome RuvABC endonuclease subunit
MKNILTFEEFLFEGEGKKPEDGKKPAVGHTVKRRTYKDDPKEEGLYSKGGKSAIKGTGYANKEKAEFTVKKLDWLMGKGERVWAMSIATTMETRAKIHQHQTPEMREAQKIFREWIDKNKLKESIEEGKSTGLFHAGDKDAVKGTGYGSKEKALATIKIIDELNKKDHRHAMAIATTMMNRATHSDNQTEGMKAAIPIFKEWIEKNRTT